jgi:hypothetical protein
MKIGGHAITQAVSRWLPTAAAQVRARVWSCGICGGQSGAGGRFSPSTSVSPAKFIPPTAPKNHIHHHQSIIGDMYNRPNGQTSMAAVQGPNRQLGT